MAWISKVPRRCVNLPPGTLKTLIATVAGNRVQQGSRLEEFYCKFGQWLGVPHVLGTSSGRSAFQLALEALDLEKGSEIIFPAFTFPVMPLVAKMLGYTPVFCAVDPQTFNAGPEHIEPKIAPKTGAILATHLFGRPCPIHAIMELARKHKIQVLEDCAHACGVRVDGRQVGTFGNVGVFSFAEGKNMPCFGGGAIATADDRIARRATEILSNASLPAKGDLIKKALSIWLKWLLTRPALFGLTAYPALRLKLMLAQPLMDSAVGDELIDGFVNSNPRISRLANLQAAVGLLHLPHIDRFNQGARKNARLLTQNIGEVPGVKTPAATDGDHIYVYYPLTVGPELRDDLRRYLLRHGIDSKKTDMADCTTLQPFREAQSAASAEHSPGEASLLEICVYPVITSEQMVHVAEVIRAWADLVPR
jgi:dTDP-4-amino-4,6-dideoxygalactose transaminase